MGLLANPWSKRLEQRRNGISDEAESLMIAFGVDAYEEARRRRTESNSLSSAHYWLQVKTEIGRRILEGCRNADSVDALDAKLCCFEPTVSRSAWSHRVQAEALLSRLEGEPADEPIRLARRRQGAGFCDARSVSVGRNDNFVAEADAQSERHRPNEARTGRTLPASYPAGGAARDYVMNDMRTAMKKGDLDGVLRALRELQKVSRALSLN